MALTKATYSLISGSPVNVLDYGADPTGTNDSHAAIQAAMNIGGTVFIPAGTYKITAPLVRSTTGLILQGAGIDATTIIAASTFTGPSMFTLGTKNTVGECRQISMRDMLINCDTNVDCGIEMYGLRDGSTFESVYVWKIRKYGIRTGWSNSGTGPIDTMNQGLLFNNCHVLARNDGGTITNGAYFDLSGLYETTFVNCKALGYSNAVHTNTSGFLIGGVSNPGLGDTDCQGVRLYNCSSGNMYGTNNVGVFFANAFHCSTDAHTIENVEDTPIKFGRKVSTGTAADQYSATYCVANTPRLYNPAASPTVNAINFEFGAFASHCKVVNCPLAGGTKLARFLDEAAMCSVDIIGANLDPTSIATLIDFTSPRYSNSLRIFTDTTTTKTDCLYGKDQFFSVRLTNGTIVEQNQFFVDYRLAKPIRFCKADGTAILTVTETGATVFNKALLPTSAVGSAGQVWMDTGAGNTLKVI